MHQRPPRTAFDAVCIAFFLTNLVLVTYTIDLEQLLIADVERFEYPVWPPARLVDLLHWWGRNYDHVLLTRPTWYRTIIGVEVALFGPFYAIASYALWRGKRWIRRPMLVWSVAMLCCVSAVLVGGAVAAYSPSQFLAVLAASSSWIIMPILILVDTSRRSLRPERGDAPRAGAP